MALLNRRFLLYVCGLAGLVLFWIASVWGDRNWKPSVLCPNDVWLFLGGMVVAGGIFLYFVRRLLSSAPALSPRTQLYLGRIAFGLGTVGFFACLFVSFDAMDSARFRYFREYEVVRPDYLSEAMTPDYVPSLGLYGFVLPGVAQVTVGCDGRYDSRYIVQRGDGTFIIETVLGDSATLHSGDKFVARHESAEASWSTGNWPDLKLGYVSINGEVNFPAVERPTLVKGRLVMPLLWLTTTMDFQRQVCGTSDCGENKESMVDTRARDFIFVPETWRTRITRWNVEIHEMTTALAINGVLIGLSAFVYLIPLCRFVGCRMD